MKKLIITCALITSASMMSFAQTAPTMSPPGAPSARPQMTPEMMAERRAKMYEKQLGLSQDEYKGVYAAELDAAKQMQQMRASGQRPGQGQMQQMMMAKDQRFKQAMSPDHYAKYDALKPKAPAAPGMPTPPPTPKN